MLQVLGGIFHFFINILTWLGGSAQDINDKVFMWAYRKFGWEEFDGEEET